jgi:hypothetical protein
MEKTMKSLVTGETRVFWEPQFGLLYRIFHLKTELKKRKGNETEVRAN